jgi:asparagine synthase (glutamine-hydrolysing)
MSAGGLGTLAEFVRTGRLLKWFNEARLVAGTGPSWRGLLATSFGPWLPKFTWRVLSKRFGPAARIDCLTLVHPDLRPALESRASARTQGGQPPADDRRVRWEALQQHEPGNFRKGVLARWGVDERDPTSDRRLAEFCLSVPAEQLFSGGTSRRLARSALADRLPPAVLNAPRGYQYPDWYEGIDQDRIERILAQIEAGPVAASLLDMSQLRQLAENWPSSDWAALHIIGTYRLALLMALSAGGFANKVCQ